MASINASGICESRDNKRVSNNFCCQVGDCKLASGLGGVSCAFHDDNDNDDRRMTQDRPLDLLSVWPENNKFASSA